MRELTVIAVFLLLLTACSGGTKIIVNDTEEDVDIAQPDTDINVNAPCAGEGDELCHDGAVWTCVDGIYQLTQECTGCGPLCRCEQWGNTAACVHNDPGPDIVQTPDADELLSDSDAEIVPDVDNGTEPCGTEFKRRCSDQVNGIEACRNGYWVFDEQCGTYEWCNENAHCVHNDPGPDDADNIHPDENTIQPDADQLLTDQ